MVLKILHDYLLGIPFSALTVHDPRVVDSVVGHRRGFDSRLALCWCVTGLKVTGMKGKSSNSNRMIERADGTALNMCRTTWGGKQTTKKGTSTESQVNTQ